MKTFQVEGLKKFALFLFHKTGDFGQPIGRLLLRFIREILEKHFFKFCRIDR